MKILRKLLFPGLFILTIIILIAGIVSKTTRNKDQQSNILKMPLFTMTTTRLTSFNSGNIKEGPVLIVRFHPECEHCQYEIFEILKSDISKKRIKILLISSADRVTVNNFLGQFDISDNKNIVPLLDTAFIFSGIFGKEIVPSNFIYDKKLELVKALYGEYKVETILKYLKSCE